MPNRSALALTLVGMMLCSNVAYAEFMEYFDCGVPADEGYATAEDVLDVLMPFEAAYDTWMPTIESLDADMDQLFIDVGCVIDDFDCFMESADAATLLEYDDLVSQQHDAQDAIIDSITDDGRAVLEAFAALDDCESLGHRQTMNWFVTTLQRGVQTVIIQEPADENPFSDPGNDEPAGEEDRTKEYCKELLQKIVDHRKALAEVNDEIKSLIEELNDLTDTARSHIETGIEKFQNGQSSSGDFFEALKTVERFNEIHTWELDLGARFERDILMDFIDGYENDFDALNCREALGWD